MAEDESMNLAAMFASMAETLRQPSVGQTLQQVVELAAETVPGAEYASVTVVRKKRFQIPACTDERAGDLDRAQVRLGEGPALEASTTDQLLRVTDIVTDQRWPRFGAYARESGTRSMLLCQLPGEHGALGSLNLYASQPHAFDATAVQTAAIYSAHASLAVSHASLVDSLNSAVSSRQYIGEATGILMERYQLSSPEAFHLLVRASQDLNVKLRELAGEVVRTGLAPKDLELGSHNGEAAR
ncbi:GAF and ANTAR domain-containing protein [Streptomyces sp. N2-109]|uniref:GAF and ANTAR domain-containing protein n=1 Tax=Streptomyces gossypii TaxID=2883101 RepID=A0ABT2JUR9_9ACTN|nr:GAF and ANTAR domain-containing protein [Streptomyces gossypii]MCT2591630.1 GAF and ANTAR domain-containing protein [Streptomyces gossypii]